MREAREIVGEPRERPHLGFDLPLRTPLLSLPGHPPARPVCGLAARTRCNVGQRPERPQTALAAAASRRAACGSRTRLPGAPVAVPPGTNPRHPSTPTQGRTAATTSTSSSSPRGLPQDDEMLPKPAPLAPDPSPSGRPRILRYHHPRGTCRSVARLRPRSPTSGPGGSPVAVSLAGTRLLRAPAPAHTHARTTP